MAVETEEDTQQESKMLREMMNSLSVSVERFASVQAKMNDRLKFLEKGFVTITSRETLENSSSALLRSDSEEMSLSALSTKVMQLERSLSELDPQRSSASSSGLVTEGPAANLRLEQHSVEVVRGGHTSKCVTSKSHMANGGSLEPGVIGHASPDSASQNTETCIMATILSSAAPKKTTGQEQDVDKAQDKFAISSSSWEMVAFVGSPQYSKAASAVVVIVLLLNVTLQLLFCAAANLSMTENEMGEGKHPEYKQWRISAHRVEAVLRTRGETLVQRVCDLDGSLSTATQQYILIEKIESYLLPLTIGIPAGTLVCMLALMIWYLNVLKEFARMYDFAKAVLHIPSGHFEVKTMEDGTYQLACLDWRRMIACLIGTLIRLSVASLLFYIGTRSIVYTNAVSELLLNALALDLILHLDEYFFELLPKRVQEFVSNLRPLQVPKDTEVLGLGRRFFTLILVVPALIVAYFVKVKPHLEDIRVVADILCSGNQQFVYATDMSGFPHATQNLRFTVDGVDGRDMIQWEMDAVTWAAFEGVSYTSAANMMVWEKDITELDNIVDVQDITALFETFQPTCEDLLTFEVCHEMNKCKPNAPESFRRFATLAMKAPITACNELAEAGACTLFNLGLTSLVEDAVLTRKLCPEACGCLLHPPSPFRTISCPNSCEVSGNSKEECKDVLAPDMNSLQQLRLLQNDVQSINEAEPILTLPEDLNILGCDLVNVWQDPYSNHSAPLPPCNKQASAVNLLSCLTVRCQDYDTVLCQNEVLHEESCQSSMPRANLPIDFPFASEGAELQISRICPWTCKTCLELPHCMFPYAWSEARDRMDRQVFRAIFAGHSTGALELSWSLLLRGLCPSTCQCNKMFADGCPAPCTPACNETLSGHYGSGYHGCQMFTRSGRLCQKWTAQVPHIHRWSGLGDHNYCRNTDADPGMTIWCYTLDFNVRWELCDPLKSI